MKPEIIKARYRGSKGWTLFFQDPKTKALHRVDSFFAEKQKSRPGKGDLCSIERRVEESGEAYWHYLSVAKKASWLDRLNLLHSQFDA